MKTTSLETVLHPPATEPVGFWAIFMASVRWTNPDGAEPSEAAETSSRFGASIDDERRRKRVDIYPRNRSEAQYERQQ